MFSLAVKIAWSSLARRRARSLLVVVMIAASLWGLLFMEGIYDGMTEQMISSTIRADCGHLSIFASGYRLDPDLNKQIHNSAAIETMLRDDLRVRSFTKRIKQDGLVATAHAAWAATIYGVNLQDENRQFRVLDYLYPKPDKEQLEENKENFYKRNGALIGYKLADKLHVKVGSKVIFSAQNLHGDIQSMALKVVGVLKSNTMLFDEKAVFVRSVAAQNLLSIDQQVSQMAIMLFDETQAAALQQELTQCFPGVDVLRWDQLYPALLQSRQMMKVSNLVISTLIFCAVSLGIFGVMLVSVLERLREFGIMRAIGTSFTQICTIIVCESLVLAGSGFLLGAALGGFTLVYFYQYGLNLSMFSAAFEHFGMDAITYAIIRPSYFASASIAVLMSALISVLLPLRILKRELPVDVINKL